ncbi:Bug family tripartite tricarboxylate transporter substrate binding protein [Aquabacter cavernae]|uniref:Bug family tripartite tricarboxylate transporter substrate binding protein n=1 Tax=Aquabacter cavernae TaxID=2496029 RepID=UPI000F8E086B|nr:tripartite tricarboxylate transporter substrate binding protein [Aquabacter cavernae]
MIPSALRARPSRRALLVLAALSLALPTAGAQAETYPSKVVKLVVPYPAGGTTDIIARLIATQLSEKLGQPFVVDNRAGASGAIGTSAVAKSAPDGYTLLMGTANTHGINSALQKSLPYDALKDFAPVTVVASTPNVIVVNPSVPAQNLQELIALAKKEPGKLNYGSTSAGGSPHMSAELLKMMTGINIAHVPYKGAAPMLTDLVGGHIPIGFDNLPSAMPFIESGKLRAIAVTTAKRWPGAPNIPTVAETVPGYEVSGWFGILAPAGTPPAIVDLLQKTVAEAVAKPEMRKQLETVGAEPVANTPAAFAKQIEADVARWKTVAETTGVKLD